VLLEGGARSTVVDAPIWSICVVVQILPPVDAVLGHPHHDPARPRQFSQFSQTPATDTGDRVVSMAFSPDGATLALATATVGVTVWDVSDPARPRELGATLSANGAAVNSMAFSPDGAALAVGADGTKVWDLDTGDAISRICTLIGVGLTRQQWSQYMPELQYDPPCASRQ
jgi:hypothetical protein